MAQTTTAISVCNVVISLDNAAGALTNISGSSNRVELRLSARQMSSRTYAGDWPEMLLSSKDASITLYVVYSTTANEGLDILRDWFFSTTVYHQARTLRIDVPDSTAGSDRYQGEVKLQDLTIPLDGNRAGPILATATLKPSGASGISHSTI